MLLCCALLQNYSLLVRLFSLFRKVYKDPGISTETRVDKDGHPMVCTVIKLSTNARVV